MFASLACSLAFLFFERGRSELFPKKIGFPNSDMVLSAGTYIYFLMENVVLILLALALLVSETRYKITCWVFLAIQVVDTVDYVLNYNEPWIASPVTFNVMKVSIFASSIAYDFINDYVGVHKQN